MQHSEEFSTSDLRHTLSEAWRIASERRWWFIFTFGVMATVAFVGSHWLPRQYTARTLFERRNDIVLQTLVGTQWHEAFEAQRRSMSFDLSGPDALSRLLIDPRLVNAGIVGDDGVLDSRQSSDLMARLAQAVEVKVIENTPQRDVVEVRMVDGDSKLAALTVTALRDNYIERSNERMVSLLTDSLDYFEREAVRAQDRVKEAERAVNQLEKLYPGVRPDYASSASGEISGLMIERVQLQSRINELLNTEQRTRQSLGTIAASDSSGQAISVQVPMRDNPERVRISNEIARVERSINDEKAFRGKTDMHPDVQLLRSRLSELQGLLDAEPLRVPIDAAASGTAVVLNDQERDRMEQSLTAITNQIAATRTRMDMIDARLVEIDQNKSVGLDQRSSFVTLDDEVRARRAELAGWQQHIEPIRRMLDAQSSDRGVRYASVQDPSAMTRPTSPNSRVVMLACLVIGLVAGALMVLLLEVFDRSFRTAAHVTRALGVQVIESIDEIITPEIRRRRMVTHLVALPAAAVVLLIALSSSAAGAWLSLEMPWAYEKIRNYPSRFMGGEEVQSAPEVTIHSVGPAPMLVQSDGDPEPSPAEKPADQPQVEITPKREVRAPGPLASATGSILRVSR